MPAVVIHRRTGLLSRKRDTHEEELELCYKKKAPRGFPCLIKAWYMGTKVGERLLAYMATNFSPDHTVCTVCRCTAGSHEARTGATWCFGVSAYAWGLKTSGWYSSACEEARKRQDDLLQEQRIFVERDLVPAEDDKAVWERWRTPEYWKPLKQAVERDSALRVGLCTQTVVDANQKRPQYWLGQQALSFSWPLGRERPDFKKELCYDKLLSSLCDVCFTLSLRLQELVLFAQEPSFQKRYAQDPEHRKQRHDHHTQTLISTYNDRLSACLERVMQDLWRTQPSFHRCEARLVKRRLDQGWDRDTTLLEDADLMAGHRYMEWCVVIRCRPTAAERTMELRSLSSLSKLVDFDAAGGLVESRSASAVLLLRALRVAFAADAPGMKGLRHDTERKNVMLTVDLLDERSNHGLSRTLLQNHTVLCGRVKRGVGRLLCVYLNCLKPVNANATRVYVLQDTWDQRVELLERESTVADWEQRQLVDLCPVIRP